MSIVRSSSTLIGRKRGVSCRIQWESIPFSRRLGWDTFRPVSTKTTWEIPSKSLRVRRPGVPTFVFRTDFGKLGSPWYRRRRPSQRMSDILELLRGRDPESKEETRGFPILAPSPTGSTRDSRESRLRKLPGTFTV